MIVLKSYHYRFCQILRPCKILKPIFIYHQCQKLACLLKTKIFEEEKQEPRSRNYHHLYDDETIETMKQYFKVEDSHDTLLDYIKKNRIPHDALIES